LCWFRDTTVKWLIGLKGLFQPEQDSKKGTKKEGAMAALGTGMSLIPGNWDCPKDAKMLKAPPFPMLVPVYMSFI